MTNTEKMMFSALLPIPWKYFIHLGTGNMAFDHIFLSLSLRPSNFQFSDRLNNFQNLGKTFLNCPINQAMGTKKRIWMILKETNCYQC